MFSFIRLYLTILFKLGRNLKGILQNRNFSSNDNSVNDKISILRKFSKSFIGKFDVKYLKWCKGVNGHVLWIRFLNVTLLFFKKSEYQLRRKAKYFLRQKEWRFECEVQIKSCEWYEYYFVIVFYNLASYMIICNKLPSDIWPRYNNMIIYYYPDPRSKWVLMADVWFHFPSSNHQPIHRLVVVVHLTSTAMRIKRNIIITSGFFSDLNVPSRKSWKMQVFSLCNWQLWNIWLTPVSYKILQWLLIQRLQLKK